ncbi:4Fe-4S dicluster domain-containing protein [Bacillus marinisedimentorum]|uniref:4Fe-4S dicluster domain-containing protein n=1 Tax=Bacillus marinisedimentorum TaxID=1821260 RepID=UPI0008727B4B|nr:4Fe-4S dicluster domain-containing protein [Bacillus marinisedimentorum]
MSLLTRWLESLAESVEISERCLRQMSPFSTCEKCIEVCQEEALKITNGKVEITEEHCTSCGKCMTVCPVHAIEGSVPRRDVIEDTMIQNAEVVPPSVGEWLYYASKGIKKLAVLHVGLHSRSWPESLHEPNRILSKMGEPEIALTDTVPVPEEKEMSRRDLFRFVGKESKVLAMSSLTPAKWRYNHQSFSINRAFPEWMFYRVELDRAACTLCEVCFKLCPNQVFTVDRERGELRISPGSCNGCELCVDACRENAAAVTEHIAPREEGIASIIEKTCMSCGQPFLDWDEAGDSCHICLKKAENKSSFF